MRKIYRLGALAMAGMATAALAGDDEFKGDSAPTWAARSLLMAKVEDDAANGTLSKRSFAVACDGITGEQMKHEYGKVPRWALMAQAEVCVGYNGYAGKFQGSKKPCVNFRKALDLLPNATKPGTPPEVTNAAAELSHTLTLLITAGEGHHGCKI